jgi:hypothetical protein
MDARPAGQTPLGAYVVKTTPSGVSLSFDAATIEDQRLITRVIYSRADRWLNWSDSRVSDNPLRSLVGVGSSSLAGFGKMLRLGSGGAPTESSDGLAKPPGKPAFGRNIAMLVLLASMLLLAYWRMYAEAVPAGKSSPAQNPVAQEAAVNYRFALSALGAKGGILLDRVNRAQTISISLPSTTLIESGELHLKYSLPEASKGGIGTFDVLLNDSALASITPTAEDVSRRSGDVVIPLPADQLVHDNRLTLRLAGTVDGACGTEAQGNAPIRIDPRYPNILRRAAVADRRRSRSVAGAVPATNREFAPGTAFRLRCGAGRGHA